MAPRCAHYTGAIDAFLSTMPPSSTLVAVLRDLGSQWPEILGNQATEFQAKLSPLLAADPADETAICNLLNEYPAAKAALGQLADQEFADLGTMRTYQPSAGAAVTAVPGQRYICPVPDCDQVLFRQGTRSVPICPVHGVVMELAPGEG